MNKRQRQSLIRQMVREKPIANQRQLVEELAAAGCRVTQATVSRDLREMGLQKSRDREGGARYAFVLSAEEGPAPPAACSRMLKEFGRGIEAAQNLVIVKCDPGTAPGMGKVIDDLEHELILGCVAGDDTVIIVSKDERSAKAVCAYLRQLGG